MTIEELIARIVVVILNPLFALIFVGAFAVFVWGLVEYLAKGMNAEARATGSRHMIWGVIGMSIMFGAIGIINIIKNTLEL